MTAFTYTMHRAHVSTSGIPQLLWSVLLSMRSISPTVCCRFLVTLAILFVFGYVGAAHFTLYEGGRFSELQQALRIQTLEEVRQESLLAEVASAKVIRADRGVNLVDVSAMTYVEGTNVVVDARSVGASN